MQSAWSAEATGLGWEFEKKEPLGFRYFHKSAHAVYRTEKFMFSMRGSTKSVHGLETHVMGMNKQGGHLTDGTLFTYATGNEYEDIYPLWNWRMLPGLTSYADLPPVRRNFMDEYNTSPNEIEDMDGGDTGDSRARLHFGFRRDGLSFVKDFEFSPKGVKVHVSGITSARTDSRVTTGIEQSLAQDDAKIFPWENGCVRAVNGGRACVSAAVRHERPELVPPGGIPCGKFRGEGRPCLAVAASGSCWHPRIVRTCRILRKGDMGEGRGRPRRWRCAAVPRHGRAFRAREAGRTRSGRSGLGGFLVARATRPARSAAETGNRCLHIPSAALRRVRTGRLEILRRLQAMSVRTPLVA